MLYVSWPMHSFFGITVDPRHAWCYHKWWHWQYVGDRPNSKALWLNAIDLRGFYQGTCAPGWVDTSLAFHYTSIRYKRNFKIIMPSGLNATWLSIALMTLGNFGVLFSSTWCVFDRCLTDWVEGPKTTSSHHLPKHWTVQVLWNSETLLKFIFSNVGKCESTICLGEFPDPTASPSFPFI